MHDVGRKDQHLTFYRPHRSHIFREVVRHLRPLKHEEPLSRIPGLWHLQVITAAQGRRMMIVPRPVNPVLIGLYHHPALDRVKIVGQAFGMTMTAFENFGTGLEKLSLRSLR